MIPAHKNTNTPPGQITNPVSGNCGMRQEQTLGQYIDRKKDKSREQLQYEDISNWMHSNFKQLLEKHRANIHHTIVNGNGVVEQINMTGSSFKWIVSNIINQYLKEQL